MVNLRVKFIRGEEIKFISHLDLMRVFERALRRSEIPVAYSKGFNPHPQMVFGLPLSVGVTSQCEYADFKIEDNIEPNEFIQRLNDNLPLGLEIMKASINESGTNIMASVAGASYEVLVEHDSNPKTEKFDRMLALYLKEKEIYMEKESKRKTRMIDIRPMIYAFSIYDAGHLLLPAGIKEAESPKNLDIKDKENEILKASQPPEIINFKMILAAGSRANLKPEFVLKSFSDYTGLTFRILKIHRLDLFVGDGESLKDPMSERVILSI